MHTSSDRAWLARSQMRCSPHRDVSAACASRKGTELWFEQPHSVHDSRHDVLSGSPRVLIRRSAADGVAQRALDLLSKFCVPSSTRRRCDDVSITPSQGWHAKKANDCLARQRAMRLKLLKQGFCRTDVWRSVPQAASICVIVDVLQYSICAFDCSPSTDDDLYDLHSRVQRTAGVLAACTLLTHVDPRPARRAVGWYLHLDRPE